MHTEAYEAVRQLATSTGLSDKKVVALDLGGQFVNGSAREHFKDAEWTGLDIVEGPGIDIVANALQWYPDKEYDLVLCTEVLEHVEDWQGIVYTSWSALKVGGVLILTCASTNRPEHGANGEPNADGQWYKNIDPKKLEKYARTLFTISDVRYNYPPGDAYLVAVK